MAGLSNIFGGGDDFYGSDEATESELASDNGGAAPEDGDGQDTLAGEAGSAVSHDADADSLLSTSGDLGDLGGHAGE